MKRVQLKHGHFFCGSGGGAMGFNMGDARVGNLEAEFVCVGGIDIDYAAIQDFNRVAGCKGTVMDLFTREQYVKFHGANPPPGWREATPEDIRAAFNYIRPDLGFTSSPCKGLSGLTNEGKSKTPRYQALNELTLRGIWLMCETWKDDPVPLIFFENVPRITSRGRHLLDQIGAILRSYGYAVSETIHDCGELGGLGAHRKRFLLVARHMAKVPPFLYEPPKRPLRSVGEVLSRMLLPGDPAAGPMHRIPSLQWKTWVRLAFVEAGGDWRSLNRLNIQDGRLADYLIIPEDYHAGYLGVVPWDRPIGTITGRSSPTNGNFSVSDPRFDGHEYQQYGVMGWDETSGTISGQSAPGGGKFSVADPRMTGTRHNNVFRVVRFDEVSPCVTSGTGPTSGGLAVADPRCSNWHPGASSKKYNVADWNDPTGCVIGSMQVASGALSVADPRGNGNSTFGKYAVTGWDKPTGTVIGASTTGQSAFAVADPRPARIPGQGDHYQTGGHYGVVPWSSPTGTITSAACHDNGKFSVADPRIEAAALPKATDNVVAFIRAEDGTWHRPLTTLDMAALQSYYDPDDYAESGGFFDMYGTSDESKRERIGNMVPPLAAKQIASVGGRTLLAAMSGESLELTTTSIWVRPVAIALSLGA
jgi:site-specific DNA-cytosine methylase